MNLRIYLSYCIYAKRTFLKEDKFFSNVLNFVSTIISWSTRTFYSSIFVFIGYYESKTIITKIQKKYVFNSKSFTKNTLFTKTHIWKMLKKLK